MPVYLDHNATAPVRPEAVRAMTDALNHVGNASSVHRFGRDARRRVEDARETVAALIGVQPGDLVFTSGGTEANNTALRGHGRTRTLVSAGEHEAVLQARPDAETVPLRSDGTVDLDALDVALAADDRPALVSVMLANNETGAINPVQQVVEIARRHGARVHCDAVQAPGKIAVDARALGVDLITVSSHKLGGPQGAGALAVLDGQSVAPLLAGGGQERKQRAGTENVPAIAGFGAAAEAALADLVRMTECAAWRDRLEAEARALCPRLQVHGAGAARLPNTSCLGLPGVRAETQVMALDLAGVAVSSGSACSSGKVHASHVLRAMGVSEDDADSAVRVSLGWTSTADDIDVFLDAWGKLVRRHGLAADAA
ncbi:cysteine desulfurase family protein [Rhodovibrio salinarum]|uniref:Cysteine desulfurase n=1 Tax=Rhodovibrio salinarum TaxID=1087 RepID=A0A934UZW8_9PROT|nr:cysteine desulfurase family protein [Rhodovibrio salinarum]MBK1697617.1 cysteine desulfurase [Rhodovibrio salinarum]